MTRRGCRNAVSFLNAAPIGDTFIVQNFTEVFGVLGIPAILYKIITKNSQIQTEYISVNQQMKRGNRNVFYDIACMERAP